MAKQKKLEDLSLEELGQKRKTYKKMIWVIACIFGVLALISLVFLLIQRDTKYLLPMVGVLAGTASISSMVSGIKAIDAEIARRGIPPDQV